MILLTTETQPEPAGTWDVEGITIERVQFEDLIHDVRPADIITLEFPAHVPSPAFLVLERGNTDGIPYLHVIPLTTLDTLPVPPNVDDRNTLREMYQKAFPDGTDIGSALIISVRDGGINLELPTLKAGSIAEAPLAGRAPNGTSIYNIAPHERRRPYTAQEQAAFMEKGIKQETNRILKESLEYALQMLSTMGENETKDLMATIGINGTVPRTNAIQGNHTVAEVSYYPNFRSMGTSNGIERNPFLDEIQCLEREYAQTTGKLTEEFFEQQGEILSRYKELSAIPYQDPKDGLDIFGLPSVLFWHLVDEHRQGLLKELEVKPIPGTTVNLPVESANIHRHNPTISELPIPDLERQRRQQVLEELGAQTRVAVAHARTWEKLAQVASVPVAALTALSIVSVLKGDTMTNGHILIPALLIALVIVMRENPEHEIAKGKGEEQQLMEGWTQEDATHLYNSMQNSVARLANCTPTQVRLGGIRKKI